MPVYAVIQWEGDEPLILSYHRRRDCAGLDAELQDPELDRFRQVIRNPDHIGEVPRGESPAPESAKSVIELQPTADPEWFADSKGRRHRIAPCRTCVHDDPPR